MRELEMVAAQGISQNDTEAGINVLYFTPQLYPFNIAHLLRREISRSDCLRLS